MPRAFDAGLTLAREHDSAEMKPLLSDRLVEFAGRVCAQARRAPRDPALEHVMRQLARSATSPAANYAEAREAVSSRDYVHRMKVCVKELRECLVWLRVACKADFRANEFQALAAECNELIAIGVACIRKAGSR